MTASHMSECAWLDAAHDQGVLPPNARAVWRDDVAPSWMITVLSFLGAQLVVLPCLAFFGALSYTFFFQAPGAFVAGAVLMGSAAVLLRARPGMFASQLGFSILMAGLAMVVAGFHGRLDNPELICMALLMVAVASFIRVGWVQRVLGCAATASLLAVMVWPLIADAAMTEWDRSALRFAHFPMTVNVVLLALLWALWVVRERRWTARQWSSTAHALADGMGVALLASVAWGSTHHFWSLSRLVSGTQGSADVPTAGLAHIFNLGWPQLLQMALVVASAAWLLHHWRLRQLLAPRELGLVALVYAVLLVACFVIPNVGVVALMGTLALGSGRRLMLGLALAALLAQLSGFYYALDWPLAHKAALLAGTGAALGLALFALRTPAPMPKGHETWASGALKPIIRKRLIAPALIAAGACLSIGMVHFDVQSKEEVIAQGQKIYIPLAPVDPRSLMQGDYMALNFAIPQAVRNQLNQTDRAGTRHHAEVVATLDARGVATVKQLAHTGQALGADERLLPIKRLKGSWVVVTDAYFFPEGQGTPFTEARYGEFRALPDGRALLVGLADEQLRPIAPAPRKPIKPPT